MKFLLSCLSLFWIDFCNLNMVFMSKMCVPEGDNPAYVAKVVETYFNYGKQNKESLAMLFITLLVKVISIIFCIYVLLLPVSLYKIAVTCSAPKVKVTSVVSSQLLESYNLWFELHGLITLSSHQFVSCDELKISSNLIIHGWIGVIPCQPIQITQFNNSLFFYFLFLSPSPSLINEIEGAWLNIPFLIILMLYLFFWNRIFTLSLTQHSTDFIWLFHCFSVFWKRFQTLSNDFVLSGLCLSYFVILEFKTITLSHPHNLYDIFQAIFHCLLIFDMIYDSWCWKVTLIAVSPNPP